MINNYFTLVGVVVPPADSSYFTIQMLDEDNYISERKFTFCADDFENTCFQLNDVVRIRGVFFESIEPMRFDIIKELKVVDARKVGEYLRDNHFFWYDRETLKGTGGFA